MGADGWIEIYDLDKAKQLKMLTSSKDEKETKTCKNIWSLGRLLRSHDIYIREIFGHSVITVYNDTEKCYFGDDELTSDEDEFVEKFEKECLIDTWEVWT